MKKVLSEGGEEEDIEDTEGDEVDMAG